MRTISVRDLQKRVRESVDAAQTDRVVRDGLSERGQAPVEKGREA